MSFREGKVSRRNYLKITGVSGVAAVGSIAGCLGGVGQSREITAGTAPGYPPFEMKEGGELIGFDIDLLEACIEASELEFGEWQEFQFESLIPALNNERIDAIAAGMLITEERKESVAFTNSYFSSDQAIVVHGDGDFSPSSMDDLSGHIIGAQRGTTGEEAIKNELIEPGKLEESNYNSYGTFPLAIQEVENGNIDALVIDETVANTFLEDHNISIAFKYQTGQQFGFAVRKNDDELLTALNNGLEMVRESGTYEELTKEYFG